MPTAQAMPAISPQMQPALPRGLRMHPRFLEGLGDLPPDVWRKANKLFSQLRRDPHAVQHLKGCKKVQGSSLNLFEARVDRGWRVIFCLQSSGEPYLLLIGDHDSTFERARRLTETDAAPSQDGAGAEAVHLQGSLPRTSPVHPATPQVTLPVGPFAGVADALFEYWEVPTALVPVVRALASSDDLTNVDGLPYECFDCLVSYAADGTIKRASSGEEVAAANVLLAREERRREQAQQPASVPAARSTLPRCSPLGLTREQLLELDLSDAQIASVLAARTVEELERVELPFRALQRISEALTVPALTGVAAEMAIDSYAEDEEDLDDFYRNDIKRLLLHLRPAQREIVSLPYGRIHLVKGVAGSGKTTVALYRARRLIRQNPEARVLFLTYTKALTRAAAELAQDLLGAERARRLEVMHAYGWMSRFLTSRGRQPRVIGRQALLDAMMVAIRQVEARRKSRLLARPPEWFLSEISESIKGRGLQEVGDYLTLARAGRESGLGEAARRVVWEVYEEYQKSLGERCDWDDIPLRCLEALNDGPTQPQYDHVIIDEAQDLSPATLRLAVTLARSNEPSVLVLADAAQSIYRRGFRWKDIGVAMHGSQVHALRHNYRNTSEVLAAANSLLANHPELREDGEVGPTVVDATPRRGPKPVVHLASGLRAEAELIAEMILRLQAEKGVSLGSIAVLALRRDRLSYLGGALARRGLPVTQHSDAEFSLGSRSVKLLTLHSAKGLEFPVVFIADVNAGVLPRTCTDPDERLDAEDQARRLLYVGMTRAMQELHLTAQSQSYSPLLLDLDRQLVSFEAASGSAVWQE